MNDSIAFNVLHCVYVIMKDSRPSPPADARPPAEQVQRPVTAHGRVRWPFGMCASLENVNDVYNILQ